MLCLIPGLPATTLVLSLLFPLYLSAAGFDYWQIGSAVALYYLASAALVWVLMRKGWKGRKLCIFGAVFYLAGWRL
ncbi:hypothetical protein COV61_03695 [Candidatus Micrarchaeota archaeon CG11_big_fil_rev_8_21_14_0_20_47_5]|nr:MAG: hypothetical protein COV61_03695 [Candidatus Micrarchaeota archaeon CG11_big_fil_rev_8_21_14_0_20_47_5]